MEWWVVGWEFRAEDGSEGAVESSVMRVEEEEDLEAVEVSEDQVGTFGRRVVFMIICREESFGRVEILVTCRL